MASEASEVVLAGDRNPSSVSPASDNRPRVQFVIDLDITRRSSQNARKEIILATTGAKPGTQVRLRVAKQIPPWVTAAMRGDLLWQIVAPDAFALEAWRNHLDGDA